MSCDCSSLNFDSSGGGGGGTNGVSAFAAGVATATGPGVSFANGNGFAFEVGSYGVGSFFLQGTYTSGGRGIQSVYAGTDVGQGTANTIAFSDGGNVSWGLNAGVLTASVGVVQTIAAGTQRVTSGLVAFADSNSVSFGAFTMDATDGFISLGRITAGVPSGGLTGTARAKYFNHRAQAGLAGGGVQFQNQIGTVSLATVTMPSSMAATGLGIVIANFGASTQAGTVTIGFGAYRILGPSVVMLGSSASQSYSWTSGSATSATDGWGAQSGARPHSISLGTFSFAPGFYLFGCYVSSAGDGANPIRVLCNSSFFLSTSPVFNVVGHDGFESSFWLDGVLVNGTTAFPPRIDATLDVYQRGVSGAMLMPQLVLLGT